MNDKIMKLDLKTQLSYKTRAIIMRLNCHLLYTRMTLHVWKLLSEIREFVHKLNGDHKQGLGLTVTRSPLVSRLCLERVSFRNNCHLFNI